MTTLKGAGTVIKKLEERNRRLQILTQELWRICNDNDILRDSEYIELEEVMKELDLL